MEVNGTAGDFSSRSSSDITLYRVRSRQKVHANFGGPRFSEWGHHGDFALSPLGFNDTIVIDQPHKVDILHLSWTMLSNRADILGLPSDGFFGPAHDGKNNDPQMYALFDRLWRNGGADQARLDVETELEWMLHRLVDWSNRRRTQPPAEKLSTKALIRVTDRLQDFTTQTASLQELADLAGLSRYHFCRAFKASAGLPPYQWQILKRIEKACSLLGATSLSVEEVAFSVGYDDPAYFSRLFRRETGFAPSDWRERRHF